MSEVLWPILKTGGHALADAILGSLDDPDWRGIHHPQRCWPADLAARYLGISHNEMNRLIVQRGSDDLGLGNPYNQLSYMSDRFMASPKAHVAYATAIGEVFDTLIVESANLATSPAVLGRRLLDLRLYGVMRLQKLNPLHLVVRAMAEQLDASVCYGAVDNVIADFASNSQATGRFKLFTVSKSNRCVLVNAIYADAQGDIHKAKEWASRGRSFPYRYEEDSGITRSEVSLLFVADGPWKPEAILKLRTAGWKVIRLEEFSDELSAALGEAND